MSASLKKFIERAPRYALRPTDNSLMRFAHAGQSGQVFTTRFLDISTSGVSFVVDREQAPFIHEAIKLEIPLEDGQQFAWWGRVVRIEEYAPHKWYLKEQDFTDESQILVAVRFEGLPAAHVDKIRSTLQVKFREVETQKKREAIKNLAALWTHFAWEIIFYVGLAVAAFYMLWAISRPSANYDAEHGAPWGKRMWFIDEPAKPSGE